MRPNIILDYILQNVHLVFMDRTVLRAVLINVIRDVIMSMEVVLVLPDSQEISVNNVSIYI